MELKWTACANNETVPIALQLALKAIKGPQTKRGRNREEQQKQGEATTKKGGQPGPSTARGMYE